MKDPLVLECVDTIKELEQVIEVLALRCILWEHGFWGSNGVDAKLEDFGITEIEYTDLKHRWNWHYKITDQQKFTAKVDQLIKEASKHLIRETNEC